MKSPRPAAAAAAAVAGHSFVERLENRTLLSAAHAVPAAADATPTSTVTLRVAPTTASEGQDIKVNVAVKGKHGKPTGTVQILDNGTALGAAGQPLSFTLKGGHTKYILGVGDIALAPGQHSLTAQYAGNGTLPAAASDPVAVTVNLPTFSTAADGLQTSTVKNGHGKAIQAGQTARVSYTGFLVSDNSIFDYATANHGTGSTPYFDFKVGSNPPEAIPGFDEGVAGMKAGEVRTVLIPSALGYGAEGSGTTIPPNSDLVFLIKLLKIVKK
jgi:FKBP-type peptidyl-prolyl cis-trans isomerase FkpA